MAPAKVFLNLFLLIGGDMELGEINSGESSKNQCVEIQIEGNIQFLYNKNKISLKSFHSPFRVSKIDFAIECPA